MAMGRFAGRLAMVATLLAAAAGAARADYVALRDVPNYIWYNGCSPTAGMMVIGYWDAWGYPNLIPGANTPSSTVNDLIASPLHIADYALYKGIDDSDYPQPYPDKSSFGTGHAANCMADFMCTSQSSAGNFYSATSPDQVAAGMARYTTWRGYSFTGADLTSSPPTWTDFIREINCGRPVVLGVDSNGDGSVDHAVTAIGYRTTYGYNEYLCRDTWGDADNPRWTPFLPPASGRSFGVGVMHTLRPAGTSDSTWKGTGLASWNTPGNWQGNTVPTAGSFVWLPSTAQVTTPGACVAKMLQMQGGLNLQNTMTLGALRLLDGGSVTMTSAASRLNATNGLISDGMVTQSAGIVTASADVVFGSGWTAPQAAGWDISGGQLNITGKLVMNPVGAGNPTFRLSGTGTLHTTGPIDVEAGRFEWYGGAITASKMHLGPGVRLIMGKSFSMNSMADTTLLGGGYIEGYHDDAANIDYGPDIEITNNATVTHSAYSFNAYALTVGSSAGPGTYLASGSAWLTATNLVVGDGGGTGTVTQSGGGNVVTATSLAIGRGGGTGTFTQSAGTVAATELLVGEAGSSGTFNWNGGTLQVGLIRASAGGKFAVGATATYAGAFYSAGGSLDVAAGKRLTATGTFGETANGQSLTKTGPGILTVAGQQSHRAGAVLNVAAGTVELTTDAGGAAKLCNLTLSVSPSAAATLGSTQHLAAINLSTAASVKVTGGAAVLAKSLSISGGTAPTGQIDIGKGLLAVDYPAGTTSPLADIRKWIIAGRNGGIWDGTGITSTDVAASLPLLTQAVGYAENSELLIPYTTFGKTDPLAVDSSTVLVRYTYAGDVNLDGRVDDDDVSVMSVKYDRGAGTSHTWAQGDILGYDGLINDDDVSLMALTYGLGWKRGTLLADSPGLTLADMAGGPAAAPEPATLALLALGALSALARRRGSLSSSGIN